VLDIKLIGFSVGLLSLILGLNYYKVKDYTRYFLTYIVVLDRDIPQERWNLLNLLKMMLSGWVLNGMARFNTVLIILQSFINTPLN
jgi:hypothetical protein